jgi:hypothetical protein
MKSNDIVALRMRSQQLTGQHATTAAEVVSRLGAMQAQDYAGTLWSVGMRMQEGSAEATEAGMERALAEGNIVRTWPLRRTYHVAAAEDVRWMLALLAPRALAGAKGRRLGLGIDDATLDKARTVVLEALADGVPRTRDNLLAYMDEAGIQTAGQRGIHILVNMAQSALICMGPRAGKEYTFVALDAWVPHAPPLAREEALGRLATRYFSGHGPATIKDFVWWAYITVADARAGIDAAGQAIEKVAVGKTEYWMAAGAMDTGASPVPHALLLPGFDEYFLGYSDRSAVMDAEHAEHLQPGANGMFKPALLVDGRVAGIWQKKVTKKDMTVSVEPFAPLAAATKEAVAAQAARFGEFLGMRGILA